MIFSGFSIPDQGFLANGFGFGTPDILELGLKIPKISKMIPNLFVPSGAPVRLADVVFGFLGVLAMIFKTK